MTKTPIPDAAVQIAMGAVVPRPTPVTARAVVAALARAGWLHDPAELDASRAPALRAIVKATRRVRDQWPADRRPNAADLTLFAALVTLDAEPATGE